MWNTEYDYKKSDEAIKALDKADQRQADMRKLRGQKEPKEVIKVEPYEPVNWIKPDFRRDGDRKYNPLTVKILHVTDAETRLTKNTEKYVEQKNIPVHIAIRRAISKTAVGLSKKLDINQISRNISK